VDTEVVAMKSIKKRPNIFVYHELGHPGTNCEVTHVLNIYPKSINTLVSLTER
jgi:hypothetical protein